MAVRIVRAVTLLLVALTLGLGFAHVLELGPKMGFPPELYLRLNTSLYFWFGAPLGGPVYLLSIVGSATLTWLLRGRRGGWLTGAAVVLQVSAFALFWTVIEPVNQRFRSLAPGEVPADFPGLRGRWEFGHATSFGLFVVAFGLLVVSILRETDR